MRFDEYRSYDGLGLAKLIAEGQVSAAEVLEAAIARAEAVNPRLNAIVTRMDEIARERAHHSLTGVFAGVPFLEKDLGQEYAGVPCSYGSRGLKRTGFAPAVHSEITERWLKAGALIFGRTNTPEFGMQLVTEPAAWGPARNPWNLERTPGGSSGGSAAAVAAGIAPLAGANDLGGSIRIPAAVCGLFGFKPGRGRTPWGPERGEMIFGSAVNHVISRSVRDSAAMLDATHGPELASPFLIAPPERPFLEEVRREGARLRIAYSTSSPLGDPIDREAAAAVEKATKLLASLGHEVEPAAPMVDGVAMFDDFANLLCAGAGLITSLAKQRAACSDADFEPDTRLLARLGHALRADELTASLDRCQDYVRTMNAFHLRYDVFMTPTTAAPAPRIGETATPRALSALGAVAAGLGLARTILRSSRLVALVRAKMAWAPFTVLANLTGAPAMSVPMHWTPEGLPMGVHFVAPASGEGLLFRLAGEIERAQPWFDLTAPL